MMMLKINLLPESARKATLSHIDQFHRTPIMVISIAVAVAIPLLLVVPLYVRGQQLQQLNAKIQTLEPKRVEVERLQRVLQQLRAQEAAFQGLGKGHGLWAKRLNILSDVTPDGVWYTELALDPARGLVIQGSAIRQQVGPEMVSVTRLVRDLEANPDFASAIEEISIESIRRVPEGEVDVVQFTLACTLKGAQPRTP